MVRVSRQQWFSLACASSSVLVRRHGIVVWSAGTLCSRQRMHSHVSNAPLRQRLHGHLRVVTFGSCCQRRTPHLQGGCAFRALHCSSIPADYSAQPSALARADYRLAIRRAASRCLHGVNRPPATAGHRPPLQLSLPPSATLFQCIGLAPHSVRLCRISAANL